MKEEHTSRTGRTWRTPLGLRQVVGALTRYILVTKTAG